MALIVTTHLWGHKYGEHYVRRLAASVHRNLTEGHRFVCVNDSQRPVIDIEQFRIRDLALTAVPGCFARLRLFDPDFQEEIGAKPGDRIVSIDLDAVATGPLDGLFGVKADFAILQDVNTTNPCRYNGSIWMLRAGARPDVWEDFSLDAYKRLGVPFHAFPDDQGWFEYKMPDAAAYGPECGVYAFKKRGWPSGDALPAGAKVVAFPGWRDPQKFEHLDWIKRNWR